MATRILIADDDEICAELTAFLLECAGYDALFAGDGGACLRIALQASPDLIICDLQMPVLSGYEVARCLHEERTWHRVPLVAVSAFSMPGDREKAFEAGFDGYLSKPITPETFVREIAAFLPPQLRAKPS
jgi:two-component system cell cycle response regulator DivK